MKPLATTAWIVAGIATWLVPAPAALAQPSVCPNPPVVTIDRPAVPSDVCIPSTVVENDDVFPFFDDYSWKAFIALVWPASPGQRGEPDTTRDVAIRGVPRVFDTFKGTWEVFRPNGAQPDPWHAVPSPHPCAPATIAAGDLVVASFSKFAEFLQAGPRGAAGPLIAQNRTYARYATGFNRILFMDIVTRGLYRAPAPGAPVSKLRLPERALVVKSAWIDMRGITARDRYYTRESLVRDPETKVCVRREIGLVGLHIVQKTASRPQWIWTTFEHVDNVPPPVDGSLGTFSFNSGDGQPMPTDNPYAGETPRVPPPPPFNVRRARMIHPSTQDTNAAYRETLRARGAVWQFYQLVLTQWPKRPDPAHPVDPDAPGTHEHTRPGIGDATSVANTTMETFLQSSTKTGCMACHDDVRIATDFLWTLKLHAYQRPDAPPLVNDPAVRRLRQLLRTNVRPPLPEGGSRR